MERKPDSGKVQGTKSQQNVSNKNNDSKPKVSQSLPDTKNVSSDKSVESLQNMTNKIADSNARAWQSFRAAKKVSSDKAEGKENFDGQGNSYRPSNVQHLHKIVETTNVHGDRQNVQAKAIDSNKYKLSQKQSKPTMPLDSSNKFQNEKGKKNSVSQSNSSSPSSNLHSSNASTPSSKVIDESEYIELKKKAKENIELKDLLAKIFDEDKKFPGLEKKAEEFDYMKKAFEAMLDRKFNIGSKLEKFRAFLASQNPSVLDEIKRKSGYNALRYFELLSQHFVLYEYTKNGFEKVKYMPMDLMKKAREYAAKLEINQGCEKLWGGYACCVKRYFAENFFIDVKSHCAISVLHKILMECSRGLLNERLLSMANSNHTSYYETSELEKLYSSIEQVEEFIRIVEKIDPNAVEQKLGNYKVEEKVFLYREKLGWMKIFKWVHSDAIFSYDFEFEYAASKLKEEDYKELKNKNII
uniref:Uncharacterized protein n=1 Tax=Meloidogyne enterolobii TaxID=390850 RepID=A0A6V7UWH2_MELEN|nr:unnamed protein product [Meloidogyne enterolobii]